MNKFDKELLKRMENFYGDCIMDDSHGIAKYQSIVCSEECADLFNDIALDDHREMATILMDELFKGHYEYAPLENYRSMSSFDSSNDL